MNLIAACVMGAGSVAGYANTDACRALSASTLTPVIELYTSEGCSSCPPADQWVSGLKPAAGRGEVVVQAFHVGYWDYIGWVDRFAAPAHTTRQRQLAALNGLGSVYTPQVVRNGRDWPAWRQSLATREPARAEIALARLSASAQGDQFEATVSPASGAPGAWSAYWTVTEHGHASRVKAGENAGEFLRHDFVVRQYTPAGVYTGPARLRFRSLPADPAHLRQVNLVVTDSRSGQPLQALSLSCPA